MLGVMVVQVPAIDPYLAPTLQGPKAGADSNHFSSIVTLAVTGS
jgi:hypothetical protein